MRSIALKDVLIKPAGPDCNMVCAYCFYREKKRLYPETKRHRMSDDVLEETIRQVMTQAGPQVSFGWQGGEPTLRGLEFFRKAVDLQQRYGRGQLVGNGLQTNGLLIDKEWLRFLRKYNFLVGLSLDGPRHIHDHYRLRADGRGSWETVAGKAKNMLDAGVSVNALSVVTEYSAKHAAEIYISLKEIGFRHMQFIPCVETDPLDPGKAAPFSVSGEAYGEFLCDVFDLWLADFLEGRPTTSIRFFDSLLSVYQGMTAPECTLLKECGVYVVIEHSGEVYSCDFFVEPRWKLGNVMSSRIVDLLNSEKQKNFGRVKSRLPFVCRKCPWVGYCRGGCIKDRIRDPRDENLNHLCRGYQMFFAHADKRMRLLAEEAEKRRPFNNRLENGARRGKTGRNDRCPCGSGLKYKKCCGRG